MSVNDDAKLANNAGEGSPGPEGGGPQPPRGTVGSATTAGADLLHPGRGLINSGWVLVIAGAVVFAVGAMLWLADAAAVRPYGEMPAVPLPMLALVGLVLVVGLLLVITGKLTQLVDLASRRGEGSGRS